MVAANTDGSPMARLPSLPAKVTVWPPVTRRRIRASRRHRSVGTGAGDVAGNLQEVGLRLHRSVVHDRRCDDAEPDHAAARRNGQRRRREAAALELQHAAVGNGLGFVGAEAAEQPESAGRGDGGQGGVEAAVKECLDWNDRSDEPGSINVTSAASVVIDSLSGSVKVDVPDTT